MRVYVDTSALLKRIFDEADSGALITALRTYAHDGVAMASSALAWVETSRAVRSHAGADASVDIDDLTDAALSGILEKPISADVVALARRLHPPVLRSLDSIHLASALLLDVEVLVAYDQGLIEGARHHGLRVASPVS